MMIKALKHVWTIVMLLMTIMAPVVVKGYDQRCGDFRITFAGNTPWLSKESVFAPGETKSQDFRVYNYSNKESNLFFISRVKQVAKNNLDSKFLVSFTSNGQVIFKKLLSDISSNPNNQELISTIAGGDYQDYQFRVKLKPQVSQSDMGGQTSQVNFKLGYGEFGPRPETITSIFDTNPPVVGGASTQTTPAGVAENTIRLATNRPDDNDRQKLDANSEVAGEETGQLETGFFASPINWLILFIILLIIGLTVWRYWLIAKRRKQEEEE